MQIILSLLTGLLPLVVIVGVVMAIIANRRGRDDGEDGDPADDEPGIGTVRRLFLFGLALVALSFAASGVAMLIGGALDSAFGTLVVADRNRALAIALSFTVVGGPAWLLLAYAAQRSLAAHPVELRSAARRLYFAIARGIALSIVVVNAITVGRFVVGVREFDGAAWGWLIAWGGVWLVHQRLADMEQPPTTATRLIDRLYLYFGAAFGFFVIAAGAATLLEAPARAAYDSAFRSSLVIRPWTEDFRAAGVVLAVGALGWWWHWLRALAVRDRLTTLWQTYVFLVGVLTGLGMAVIPAAMLLHAGLQWLWGDPSSATAAEHFAGTPVSVAILIVGAAIWGYHRAVIGEAASAAPAPPPPGPERVYRYLVTAVGLLTASLGIVILLTVAADALAEPGRDLVYSAGWWRNRIVAGVTLLAVGVPLWGRYWLVSQRAVADPVTGDDERGAQSRRVFTFAAIGIAVVALLISLTIVLFRLFEAVLDATLSRMVLRDAREAIGTALSAGAVAVYYWLVLREDQQARESLAPDAAPVRRRDVMLLAPAHGDALARTLGEIAGVRVRARRRLDDGGAAAPPLTAAQIAALRDAIATSDADRLVVIVGREGYEVVPYTE